MVKNNYKLCFSSHAMICNFLTILCIFNCLLLYKSSHTCENQIKIRNSSRSLLQYLLQLVAFYCPFYYASNGLRVKIFWDIEMSANFFQTTNDIYKHVFHTNEFLFLISFLQYNCEEYLTKTNITFHFRRTIYFEYHVWETCKYYSILKNSSIWNAMFAGL